MPVVWLCCDKCVVNVLELEPACVQSLIEEDKTHSFAAPLLNVMVSRPTMLRVL
jgi:hypothetical protein